MAILPVEYLNIKEISLHGRYLSHKQIDPLLRKMFTGFSVGKLGESVQKKSIEIITLGSGKKKVLMWSQMHGNESTTTKAIFDLLNYLKSDKGISKQVLGNCTLKIIPMLNPDGAEVYTRVNANGMDLNRDAKDLSQPESKLLRQVFEDFRPHFCFNLHDQRTIFSVGNTPKPATVSFLAPAQDSKRSITSNRGTSMKLIAAMAQTLEQTIPGQVGRYDDSFNENCVGDTFQMLNTPTILFEAGHYPNDYQREKTREFILVALLKGLKVISEDSLDDYLQEDYFHIPENRKLFFDILVRNAHLIHPKYQKKSSLALQYQEMFAGNKIQFVPKVETIGLPEPFFGHQNFDCADPIDFAVLKKQAFWKNISQ